jgi:hypothetical protein
MTNGQQMTNLLPVSIPAFDLAYALPVECR